MRDDERIAFRLELDRGEPMVYLAVQRLDKRGAWKDPHAFAESRALDVTEGRVGDATVADYVEGLPWTSRGAMRLRGRAGGVAVARLLESDRLFLGQRHDAVALRRGEPLPGELSWQSRAGTQEPAIRLERSGLIVIPLAPLYWVDVHAGEMGPIAIDGDLGIGMKWLAGPPVDAGEASQLSRRLAALDARVPAPAVVKTEVIHGPPRAILRLMEEPAPPHMPYASPRRFGELSFRYGAHRIDGAAPTQAVVLTSPERVVRIERSLGLEDTLRAALVVRGLVRAPADHYTRTERWTLGSAEDWLLLLDEGVESLREAGVDIEVDPSFSLTVLEGSDWFTEIEPAGIDWFDVDFGIRVDDRRIQLLPLLVTLLVGGELPDKDAFFVEVEKGRFVRVPRARVEPLVDLLVELAETRADNGKSRASRLRAMDLAASIDEQGATFTALRQLRERLSSNHQRAPSKLPRTFRGQLRDYQADGVAWLSLLREAGLGAVLADDMGLGKTVQLLAHLCATRAGRAAGRKPSLVVAPTSVLLAWSQQVERFAPKLRAVLWSGPHRDERIGELATADLVLTSYALLRRDAELLTAREWDICVLDEAQAIKNARSELAARARELRATQRIALTGTPVENHLGELWSIVSFAVPGALGSERAFRAAYRLPIEKRQSEPRLEDLRRRIAPILLRRTKEAVARELPPKTIIEHPIELHDSQRDLYETIRATVEKRLREAIASRGLARSQILFLDALLKLRQVCCDPRLVKTETTRRSHASAKLEAFEELVTTLADEGRKILVFSQFVEMIELLEASLRRLEIEFSTLHGGTRDRAAAVARFRTGSAKVFLISLKAGGTGLDLIEADTVIHYDPWWNPAAEAQATDRAHRIGQDKPVFVHRLIASGTVEQRIVELQEKKGALARGLLEGGGAFKLDAEAVEALLAPLPRARG